MICIDAEHLQDGLYNIKNGKIYKYRAKGGTARVYRLENRPQGEWITTLSGHWKCSRCNCRAGFWFEEENSCEWDMDMSEWLSDFCPSCGARMKGADDE